MQVVCNETGVPPETLRSWERRHGFPVPGRTPSGHRRYSERDIVAVGWLRDQTELGQGISDAIAMLHRINDAPSSPSPVHLTSPAPVRPEPALLPIRSLSDALLAADPAEAQAAWDRLALATSADALLDEALLPAWTRITSESSDHATRSRAQAFLLRKAVVLFDQSAPESGLQDVVILTGDSPTRSLPAWILGTALSRAGFRLSHPFLDATQATTVALLSNIDATTPIIIVEPSDASNYNTYSSMYPKLRLHRWWPNAEAEPVSKEGALPTSLRDVPTALMDRR